MLSADWSSVLLSYNVSESWNSFKHIFLSIVDNIAPLKQIRIKQRTEPWINSDILKIIQDRDNAFNHYKMYKNDVNFNNFKSLRNKAQYAIDKAKQSYFTDTLEHNKNDSKSLWKSL